MSTKQLSCYFTLYIYEQRWASNKPTNMGTISYKIVVINIHQMSFHPVRLGHQRSKNVGIQAWAEFVFTSWGRAKQRIV